VLPLEFQVFDQNGDPALTLSYKGEGTVTHDQRIILGDPYRDTNLLEGTVERQATSESWDYSRGFKAALEDRREEKEGRGKKHYAQTKLWWEGYQTGWREKREKRARLKKNSEADFQRPTYRIARGRFGDKTHVIIGGSSTTLCGFWTRGRLQYFKAGTPVTCAKCARFAHLVKPEIE
jgi:hypothetical protein